LLAASKNAKMLEMRGRALFRMPPPEIMKILEENANTESGNGNRRRLWSLDELS